MSRPIANRPVIEGVRHGTVSAYFAGCRCPECTEKHNVMCAQSYQKRVASLKADPTSQPHGTVNTYSAYGCRCERCREASRVYNRNRKRGVATPRLTPTIGPVVYARSRPVTA